MCYFLSLARTLSLSLSLSLNAITEPSQTCQEEFSNHEFKANCYVCTNVLLAGWTRTCVHKDNGKHTHGSLTLAERATLTIEHAVKTSAGLSTESFKLLCKYISGQ